ncbi:serine hydrolase [Streptomyces sp. NBC_01092]|uniref:serine hydrolase n=1 Tax=Streptomyces sp. NBC_01092 TaxID=2903748 RepID=UPI00386BDFD0|nr:class A beta-lactamase-related serine hydrolase [Streptomyces sp. NBC_01092]
MSIFRLGCWLIAAATSLTVIAGAGVTGTTAAAPCKTGAPVSGNLSVAVVDMSTGATGQCAPADHKFATASTVKVDILAALLLKAQEEGRELTAVEQANAEKVIKVSDNAAATYLWNEIGGTDGLAKANQQLGLVETAPDTAWGVTTTTASDQIRLLKAITTRHSPLTPENRAYAHDLMTQVEADQAWGVSAAADPGSTTALKNGWLPRSATGLWVVNTIGEVQHDGHRLLMAVVSDDQESMEAGVGRRAE